MRCLVTYSEASDTSILPLLTLRARVFGSVLAPPRSGFYNPNGLGEPTRRSRAATHETCRRQLRLLPQQLGGQRCATARVPASVGTWQQKHQSMKHQCRGTNKAACSDPPDTPQSIATMHCVLLRDTRFYLYSLCVFCVCFPGNLGRQRSDTHSGASTETTLAARDMHRRVVLTCTTRI